MKYLFILLLAGTLQAQTYSQLYQAEINYELNTYFKRAAKRSKLPIKLLKAIAHKESKYKNVKNNNGCVGIMQVKGGSFNPRTNIMQGAMIFKYYLIKCAYDTLKALTAYNRGYTGMKRYYRKHHKASKYAIKVMNYYHKLGVKK